MTVKYKHLRSIVVSALALCAVVFVTAPLQVAADAPLIAPGCSAQMLDGCTTEPNCTAAGGTFINNTCAVDKPGSLADPAASGTGKCDTLSDCDLIERYLNPAIQLLSAMVGVVIAISIVIGGIQYASSAGDPQAAAAARARIRNAVFALVVFVFLYALLNFLIPGGLFHG